MKENQMRKSWDKFRRIKDLCTKPNQLDTSPEFPNDTNLCSNLKVSK